MGYAYDIADHQNLDEIRSVLDSFEGTLDLAQEIMEHYKEKSHYVVSTNRPFVVTFVGRFKTGKSSLINALTGHNILPTRATTATAVVTRIVKGPSIKAWQIDGSTYTPISVSQAQDLILNYRVKKEFKPPQVEFELPISWLPKDVVLVDTPGTDDSAQDGALEEVALAQLHQADLCVCVFDAGSFLSGNERSRIKMIHEKLAGNVLYAINRINLLSSQEGLKQVEEQAKLFFSSMQTPHRDMGKYFLMCSAPNDVYLNGFDTLFSKLLAPNHASQRNAIRRSSAKGQMRFCAKEAIEAVEADLPLLDAWETALTRQVNEEHERQKKAAKERAKAKADHIKKTVVPEMVKLVAVGAGLRATLQSTYADAEKMKKYSDYPQMCKAITQSYLRTKYIDACYQMNEGFQSTYFSSIESTIDRLQFPDKHFITIPVKFKDRAGGVAAYAAAGAALGSFLPGIGTAVGASMGAAFGYFSRGSGSTSDESIENTMKYIEENVVPVVRTKMEEIGRSIANSYIKNAEKATSRSLPSEQQRMLDWIRKVKKDFVVKKQEMNSMIYD